MTSLLKIKRPPFVCAGAGVGLAFIAGALGWHVGSPAVEKVALPGLMQPPAVDRTLRKPTVSKPLQARHFSEGTPTDRSQTSAAAIPPSFSQPAAQPLSPRYSSPVPSRDVEQVMVVDPDLPGNFLVANGLRVAIQQKVTGSNGSGVALDVVITPVVDTVGTSPSAQDGSDVAQNQTGRGRTGFTYEQELFRSKWGWAAYNAANRGARWNLQTSAPVTQ
ncbi:MAG: hypothetical protein JWR15_4292 [Prosthecobacter sp.]|nr:hypothetical protein [Prosthecobacter sp.]